MDNLLDDLKIPGFRLVETLGVGGMARVYLAEQESLKRKVAIKVMHAAGGKAYSERFLNEGRLIAALNHRNVLTIHDIGVLSNGLHFISMEYVEGGSLEQRLRHPLEPEQALEVMVILAETLEFVHRQGIVHRDIKPANILFRADGTLLLTDFGIAKQLEQDLNLTLDGAALGSPFYFSPEQAQGRPLDGRADLYSLGVILYEMLMGAKPFQGDTPIDTIIQHIQSPIPRFPERLSRYQPLLDVLLAKEPDGRPRNAQELLILLDRLHDLPARPRSPAENWSLQPGSRWLVSAVVLFVLLIGILLFAFWRKDSASVLGPQIQVEVPTTPATPTTQGEPEEPASGPIEADDSLGQLIQQEQWTNTGTSAEPAPESVASLLAKAKGCRQEQPLDSLQTNCAVSYFQQVLQQQPDNTDAKTGLSEMADAYLQQAQQALAGNKPDWQRYVELGLEIEPERAALRMLLNEPAD